MRIALAALALLVAAGCTFPCDGDSAECVPRAEPRTPICQSLDCWTPPETPLGWDDAPGTGLIFVLNQFAIAAQDRGFDLDGDGEIDNALWQLGEIGNDQIRQGLLGGEQLMLIELAGLELGDERTPHSLTVKMYRGIDADDPAFPENNFKVPPGHTKCCEFLIDLASIENGQSPARYAAVWERGRVRSIGRSNARPPSSGGPLPIALHDAQISFRQPASLRELSEGLIGGVATFSDLASTPNPYCKTVSPRCPTPSTIPTMLGLISSALGMRADIDRDGDGNECVFDVSGSGDLVCCDGAGTEACNDASGCRIAVPPMDPSLPLSCASRREMADGFSGSIAFTAVRAFAVGFK